MKRKCEVCHGKGGYWKKVNRLSFDVFVSCQQCKGRGSWYDNKKPKRKGKAA